MIGLWVVLETIHYGKKVERLVHHGTDRRVVAIVARFLLCGGGQLAGRAQLWRRVLW